MEIIDTVSEMQQRSDDLRSSGERIAFVGNDASHTIGDGTQVIDAAGKYLVPGLLDGHMHIESGMVTVTEFVRTVAPRGTTGMFIDPHEIANVFGIKSVKLMVDEDAVQPIHVWVQVPSCVPSAPGLETPGAPIDPDEIAEDILEIHRINELTSDVNRKATIKKMYDNLRSIVSSITLS